MVTEPSTVLITAAAGALLGAIATAAAARIAETVGAQPLMRGSPAPVVLCASLGLAACGAYLELHYRPLDAFARISFLAALWCVALVDARTRLIPNFLSIPGILLGAIAGALVVSDVGYRGVLLGISCALLVMLSGEIYRLLRGREGIGMGDIKLMMMIGAFAGWSCLLFAVGGGALSAVFGTLASAAIRRVRPGNLMLNTFAFGPYLCGAAAVYLLFQFQIAGA